MEIVNGYTCFNCTDVANAKKNVDPAHPKDDPRKADASAPKGAASSRDPAVTFGGSLSAPNSASDTDNNEAGEDQQSRSAQAQATAQSARASQQGALLDITA